MNAKRIISVSLALIILICSTFITSVGAYELPINFYVAEEGANPSDIDGRVFGYVGDTDVSEVVNIKDATVIQKYLANLFELSDAAIYVADVNFSGKIDIRDATAIQKWIANYDVDAPISRLLYSVDIVVDFTQFAYDEGSDVYYALDTIASLGGTFRAADMIKKASYTVSDVNGKVLVSREIDPKENWNLDNIAFIVGENYINITIEYTNGDVSEKNFVVNNVCEENMESLNVDKNDDDNDGVLNFTEELYGTNKTKADTDGDGISDYFEMAVLGLNPLVVDTDENGVDDGDEDADNDGITNIEEIVDYDTDSICVDTDGDSLSDFDEIKIHLTDPKLIDTDGDEKNDYWELQNGYNPSSADEAFATFDEADVPDGITVVTDGYISITEYEDDTILNDNTPGYIGNAPVYVEMENGTSADVTFDYDTSQLEEGEIPGLYYYDEEAQSYEKVESVVNESGQVTGTITKPGVYILLNHRLVEEVWDNDILKPSDVIDDGSMDIVFVIDRSASMDSNDPNAIRKDVTKEFINKLRDGVDKAAVVQFTAVAETIMPLTHDKDALLNAVDGIENSDGGGCAGSDQNAGTNGSAGIRNAITELENSTADHKYIIFLTDGDDTAVSEDYGDETGTFGLTGEAKGKDIVIHTVGLVGSGTVDTDLLKRVAEGTGGNYYLATVGDPEVNEELVRIYDEIEGVTIDRYLDSNNDGISDYYTKMLCDNRLGSGTGLKNIFGVASYDEVQKSDDLDGDGLKNGEEIEIVENGMGVYAKVHSYPYIKDTDFDGNATILDDLFEHTYSLSSFKANGYVDVLDINWLTDSENFQSDRYLDLYEDSILERGSVCIGNAFFGTTLDQSILYRQALVDYFNSIDEEILSDNMIKNYKDLAQGLLNSSFEDITENLIKAGESGDSETFKDRVEALKDLADAISDTEGVISDSSDLAGLEDPILKLITLGDRWNLEDCKYQMDVIRKHMSSIPSRVTDATREGWINRLNEWSEELYTYGTKSDILSEKIEIKTAKYSKFTKGFEILDCVTFIADIGMTMWDSYVDYCDTIASLETVENNAYILDCIIASSDNTYLSSAARDLRFYINDALSKEWRELSVQIDINEGMLTSAALETLHFVIGNTPSVPTIIIELVRTIGNLVFDLDKLSEYASKTVALAKSAVLLAANLDAKLNSGYAVFADLYWVGYADYSNEMYISLLNLAELRKCSEIQMKEFQGNEDFNVLCDSNINECDRIISEYNVRRFAWAFNSDY